MRHAFRVINMRKGLVAYDLTRVVSSFSSFRATDPFEAKMKLKFFQIFTSPIRLVSKIFFFLRGNCFVEKFCFIRWIDKRLVKRRIVLDFVDTDNTW